jgi:hypothetical protein
LQPSGKALAKNNCKGSEEEWNHESLIVRETREMPGTIRGWIELILPIAQPSELTTWQLEWHLTGTGELGMV